MHKIKILFFLLLIVSGLLVAQEKDTTQIPAEIVLGLKSGNAKLLSGYFNQNIELTVPGNENVYSKAQAQQVMGNFFSVNTPENFAIIYKGKKKDSKYVIGTLKTRNGIFRVYFLLKQTERKDYIHQLKIEKQ